MTTKTTATALVVIDVQESALTGCFDLDGVLARINGLVRRVRAAARPVIFVQHEDPKDSQMDVASPGWQLSPVLDRLESDPVVAKTYRDAFADTDLDAVLGRSASRHLLLTGVHSDFCVMTTALSALQRGYDITLVSDAHSAQPAVLAAGSIPAQMVVELVNARFTTLRSPGRTIEVTPAENVAL